MTADESFRPSEKHPAPQDRRTELEGRLNDFDRAARSRALEELLSLAEAGEISLSPAADVANMHCHTFFSFNAYGHSPTSLAWLARKQGFRAVGTVDFDVLDSVDEALEACDAVGVRGCASIETRVFVPEYATQEINSPGEPGVFYHTGLGFRSSDVPPSVASILADLRQRASQRNRAIMARVNAYLDPATIDYDEDVLPLTPAGNPTERHIVVAYLIAADRVCSDPAAFWSQKLGVSPDKLAPMMPCSPALQNLIRAKLMKQGGVGYVRPESGKFPQMGEFQRLIEACGALPCACWLDGTSETERYAETWLRFLVGRGVLALNIIPDRNWNVADPETRRVKVANLCRVVEVARELDLPLIVGTEMNSFGQKLVDDFDALELVALRQAFLDGAHFAYGHTVLQRALGFGYQSEWAQASLHKRSERNAFYIWVGYHVPPGKVGLARLTGLGPEPTPVAVMRAFG